MKLLTLISRLLVGSLFIVSGLIKANDPLGFSYKLNDYFAPGVLDLPWLDPFALELSVFICVAEIVLGVAILFGSKMKLASWSLLLMMVFFTFLTGYTAIGNWFFDNPDASTTLFFEDLFGFKARQDISYMKDCGCFGDALKLDPWESFLKDVVLLVFSVIIFLKRKVVEPADLKTDLTNLSIATGLVALFGVGVVSWAFPIWFSLVTFAVLLGLKHYTKLPAIDWMMALAATVISTVFSIYCVRHLPVRDYRPYKVGNHIPSLITCPDDAPKDIYKNTWLYRVNGEVKEFADEDKPWEIEGAEFVDRESVLVQKGCEPPIHDFVLEGADGNDYTEDVLAEPYVFLVVAYDLGKVGDFEKVETDGVVAWQATVSSGTKAKFDRLNQLVEGAFNNGLYVYGLTATSPEKVEAMRHAVQNQFDYLTVDATALKTVIRSTPGVVLLKQGTVIGKWHFNDIPEFAEIQAELL